MFILVLVAVAPMLGLILYTFAAERRFAIAEAQKETLRVIAAKLIGGFRPFSLRKPSCCRGSYTPAAAAVAIAPPVGGSYEAEPTKGVRSSGKLT